jgi:uncharacterized repeat protein (TIGR02543 family)
LNNDAGTIIDHEELNKLYIPGRIDSVYSSQRYVSYYRKDGNQINDRNNLIIYYCGEVLALWGIGIPSDFYVPAERFDEFVNYQSEHESMSYQYNIKKANISYRLNAEDLAEYYYVDYVDYGEKITNIPPEPERYGYTFDGWYTESDCITKWNFNTPTQTLADDQDFMELKLYAKWTTK